MSQESDERFNVLFASDFLHDAMQLTEADKQSTADRSKSEAARRKAQDSQDGGEFEGIFAEMMTD